MSYSIENKILITVIHNDEIDRLNYLRPRLQKLTTELDWVDISYWNNQASSIKSSVLSVARKVISYFKVKLLWNNYLNNRLTRNDIVIRELRQWFNILSSPNRIRKFLRLTKIEHLVTLKHIEAIENFLETDYQSLIVLESDAIIDNHDYMKNACKSVQKVHETKTLCYISLGGGFSLEYMEIPAIEEKSEIEGIRKYSKAFTNTAVAYALNRDLALQIIEKSKFRVNHLMLPIDWHLNCIFATLYKKDICVTGYEFRTDPISHGSMQNNYVSWQKLA